jgi:hypothetical protein
VDLRLKFNVIPQREVVVAEPLAAASVPSPAPTRVQPGAVTAQPVARTLTPAVATAAATVATSAAVTVPVTGVGSVGVGGIFGETNGGTTIDGFPTVESFPDHITVDAGLACSSVIQTSTMTPPVTTSSITINIPGHPAIRIQFFVLRPPAVALGAFTIPALPMTIVYAPPQGKQLKNSATYQDAATVSRTVSSSITSTTNTKTVQAYTAADLIGKVAGAITAVVAVVGSGGADAGGGASVAGALSQLGQALFGGAKDENDSAASAAKQVSSELTLVSNILNAVDNQTTSDNATVTVQDDHSLTLTISNVSTYGSEAALGPGVGDRIVYMSNVKVVWMAVNGEVGIHILGFDGIGANSVQDLQQEQQRLQSGGASTLHLDLDTIASLLSMDPLISSARPVITRFGGPAVGPPRFVPANPPGRKGSGTGSGGDIFQASFDVATDDKHTTTNSKTTVTDLKPGWVSVLFGADNTETTTTATFTNTQSVDDKADDKITSTITLFSTGLDDPYDVKIFYDNTFGTYAILDSNSPLLQGVVIVGGTIGGTIGTGVFTR